MLTFILYLNIQDGDTAILNYEMFILIWQPCKILISNENKWDNTNNFYTHHDVRNNKKDTISPQMKRDF